MAFLVAVADATLQKLRHFVDWFDKLEFSKKIDSLERITYNLKTFAETVKMSRSFDNDENSGGTISVFSASNVTVATTTSEESVTEDDGDPRCLYFDYTYDITTAVICGMYLVFGVVYTLYGYRCFKAAMFLTGFIFGSVVVYMICLEEDLLPPAGNAGVALGAGVLFGLITMLVQYVGLFMTGFHMGLFIGVGVLMLIHVWYTPTTMWITVAVFMTCGLLGALITLFFQKGCTILGTSIYGGAIIAASTDYFIEKFIMVNWVWDRIRLLPSIPPCWFSWLLLGVWPFMVLVGTVTQWRITGRGTHHEEMGPSRRSRQLNLQRIRNEESRAEQRQRKYRYLYQVRTAHGDVISQSYIQSLQKKVCPHPDDSMTTLRSDLTHLTVLNPSDSTATTMSQVP